MDKNIQTQIDGINQVAQQLTYPLDYASVQAIREALGTLSAFPIGSIFISVVATNPATLLGYGTWSAFGAGRTLVGLDSGQTEFDTVEETGGAKTHTLTTAEMPAHTHDVDVGGANTGGNKPQIVTSLGGSTATAAALTTGGGGSHNNLQPYIVTYMWKRTA
jgi:hypothetical protein